MRRLAAPTASRIAARLAATSPTRSTSGARLAVSAFGAASRRISFVSSPKLAPKPSRKSSGTPTTSATSAPSEAGAAGAAEGELVVGGQAAAAEAVEEDRDAERLGQRPQLVLAAAPVEAGAGHDRRPLGRGQQRRRLLDARRPGRASADRRRRDLGLGLGEDDVERVVDEGRAARAPRAPGRAPPRSRAAIRAGSFTVSADLTSGETKGRWSISCSEPEPQRISGARPPSTQTGEPLAWAPAIALIPLVTPGPGGQRRDARRPRVALAKPSAAKAAVCSWRTSTISIPSALQPS